MRSDGRNCDGFGVEGRGVVGGRTRGFALRKTPDPNPTGKNRLVKPQKTPAFPCLLIKLRGGNNSHFSPANQPVIFIGLG
jgi:hypothetical protein